MQLHFVRVVDDTKCTLCLKKPPTWSTHHTHVSSHSQLVTRIFLWGVDRMTIWLLTSQLVTTPSHHTINSSHDFTVWQVDRVTSWLVPLGLRVGGHPALSLRSSNEPVNSRSDHGHDDSTINIVNELLWSPYVIGQTIIFSCCFFFLSSSFFFLA